MKDGKIETRVSLHIRILLIILACRSGNLAVCLSIEGITVDCLVFIHKVLRRADTASIVVVTLRICKECRESRCITLHIVAVAPESLIGIFLSYEVVCILRCIQEGVLPLKCCLKSKSISLSSLDPILLTVDVVERRSRIHQGSCTDCKCCTAARTVHVCCSKVAGNTRNGITSHLTGIAKIFIGSIEVSSGTFVCLVRSQTLKVPAFFL